MYVLIHKFLRSLRKVTVHLRCSITLEPVRPTTTSAVIFPKKTYFVRTQMSSKNISLKDDRALETMLPRNWTQLQLYIGPTFLIFKFLCINLQATKLFIVTSATKGGGPLRFRVRFKILYRIIQPLIQHGLLCINGVVEYNICYCYSKLWIFYYRNFSVINELLRYSTVTTYVLAK